MRKVKMKMGSACYWLKNCRSASKSTVAITTVYSVGIEDFPLALMTGASKSASISLHCLSDSRRTKSSKHRRKKGNAALSQCK